MTKISVVICAYNLAAYSVFVGQDVILRAGC